MGSKETSRTNEPVATLPVPAFPVTTLSNVDESVETEEDDRPSHKMSSLKHHLSMINAKKSHAMKMLNQRLPYKSKEETKTDALTFEQKLYIELLQEGYFNTFEEIFGLVTQQAKNRLEAGPNSVFWNRTPLNQCLEKITKMAEHLKKAEAAARQGMFSEVYHWTCTLAKQFKEPEDLWLADRFLEKCLMISKLITGDKGEKTAEAHCNFALIVERRGNLYSALENFTAYYKLTVCENWLTDSGEVMRIDACKNMARVYSKMAMQCKEEEDLEAYQENFTKAFIMAKKSGDAKLINDMTYELGVALRWTGNIEKAVELLNTYLDFCEKMEDKKGKAKAYEAIGLAHQSNGQAAEAVFYFQKAVKMGEQTKDGVAVARASLYLGVLNNYVGDYEQSNGFFSKAFKLSRLNRKDKPQIVTSRVQCGISSGHRMLTNYLIHYDHSDRLPFLERLLDWKDWRHSEFDQPVSFRVPEIRREVRRVQLHRSDKEDRVTEKKSGMISRKIRRASIYAKRFFEQ